MLPVYAMCGHRWGLHITATTAIPDDVPVEVSCQHLPYIPRYPAILSQDPELLEDGNIKHTDGLSNQLRKNVFLVMLRNGGNNRGQRGNVGKFVFLRQSIPQAVEVDILWRILGIFGRLMVFNERVGHIGAAPEESFVLGGEILVLGLVSTAGRDRCRRRSRHDGEVIESPSRAGLPRRCL